MQLNKLRCLLQVLHKSQPHGCSKEGGECRCSRECFGQKDPIKIVELFDWRIEDSWDDFWVQRVRSYREEMESYELSNIVLGLLVYNPSIFLKNDPTDLGQFQSSGMSFRLK